MKEDKLISKSEYSAPQVGNFILAKQYMLYRYQGRKCLLIRFANESEFTVDSFEFTLIQLDSKGAIIGEVKSSCDNLHFEPGTMYAMDKGIVVDDRCVDCRIQLTSAISGKYLYRVNRGRSLSIHYMCDEKWSYIKKTPKYLSHKKNRVGLVAQQKDKHSYKWLRFVAVIAALLLILINMIPYIEYWMYGDMVYTMSYDDAREPLSHSICCEETEDLNKISGEDYAEI